MLPRWHILLGFIFSLIIWIIFPETSYFYIALVFLSSFIIDFDHYCNAVLKTGKLGLFRAFDYHKDICREYDKEIKKKGRIRERDLQVFHTVEFNLLLAVLGFLWSGFWYILLGILFHIFLDLIYQARYRFSLMREYSLIHWFATKI